MAAYQIQFLTGTIFKMNIITHNCHQQQLKQSTRRHKSRSVASIPADHSVSKVLSKSETVIALQPKYKSQIPISKAKKKDLMDLCRSKATDEVYYSWYEALPVASGVVNKLLLPDVDENSCGEE